MKKIRADDGGKGDIEKCSGKNGATCYMHVPIGTSIYDANTNELIVDILRDKQEFVICQGGKGGKGNAAFKSSFNKVPTLHENGDLGEEKNVILKLRYIADVGLLGLPNAGKSTFISKVSNAKPKIANYQFTTLVPNLGSVKHSNRNIVFADIPGLIEGASEGKGLGHEFLKHIERCDVLIHLVSLNPDDNEEPYQAYKTILNELELYEHKLIKKPMYIVANKSDLDSDGSLFKEFKKHFKKEKIYLISALNNEGLNELLKDVFSKCDEIYQEEQSEEQEKMKKDLIKVIELKPEKDYAKDLTIEKDDDGN
jgi:GTP-binding protein